MTKAERACSSARALLDLGDVDGSVNRAYYAMFDAARAALLASGAPVAPDIGRTHSRLIGAFGKYAVKTGKFSKDIGRILNRAHEIRLMADYGGESIEFADAKEIVEQAAIFVDVVRAKFWPEDSVYDGCTIVSK